VIGRAGSRLSRRRRGPGVAWLVAAGALALIAVVLTGRAAAGRPSRDAVLVAQAAVAVGTDLESAAGRGLLVPARVPEGLTLGGLVRDLAQIAGRPLVVPLSPGEPLTEAALGGAPGTGPAPLGPGERAISVPAALAGVGATALRPGVRVDVVASTGEGLTGRSRMVVPNVEVLQVGGVSEGGGPSEGGVLLRVSARQALGMAEALDFAREVRLVIRPVAGAGS
jgi:Flp pilus assembly protein CpaB